MGPVHRSRVLPQKSGICRVGNGEPVRSLRGKPEKPCVLNSLLCGKELQRLVGRKMGPDISQSGMYRSAIPATRGASGGLSQVQDSFGLQSEFKASLSNLGEIL